MLRIGVRVRVCAHIFFADPRKNIARTKFLLGEWQGCDPARIQF